MIESDLRAALGLPTKKTEEELAAEAPTWVQIVAVLPMHETGNSGDPQ